MWVEAIDKFQTRFWLDGSGTQGMGPLGFAYACAGRTNVAQRILGQLLERQGQGSDFRVDIAMIQHALGQDEVALDSLEQALAEHSTDLLGLNHSFVWKDLRPHARVQAILTKMNLVK
jgi:hypothetical protein